MRINIRKKKKRKRGKGKQKNRKDFLNTNKKKNDKMRENI